MVRKYKRKTQRQSWSIEQLSNAVAAIRSGSKIRAAARNFNIPESTIRDHLKQIDDGGQVSTTPALKIDAMGRKPIFTKQQEHELADHIVKLGNLFYGVTPRELRRIAFDFAEANHLTHKFNRETKLAGKDWLSSFLKRNPQLSLRQPEGTSINRISSFNAEAVGIFFKNLEEVLSKYQFRGDRIFNADETGITTVQKKSGKVYAKKGQKQVGVAISAERGQTITMLSALSASGSYIPPMIIYPRKRMSPQLEKDGPIGCIYSCSDNGWSNDSLFLKWLKHFQSYVKATATDPVLLILDNHASHISLEIYDFCRNNHIVILTIPPHTSNHLQPLDLTFFGPFKKALFAVYDSHMISTAHEKITVYDVARLVNQAYIKVATMDKGISGFRAAGIFPYNPNKFTVEDFAPAEEFRELVLRAEPEDDERKSDLASPQASTSKATPASVSSIIAATSEPSTFSAIPESMNPTTSVSIPEPVPSCSFVKVSEIAPIPKRIIKHSTRKTARKQQSEILTSTPMKTSLLEKQAKRNEKNDKQTRKGKKKANNSDKGHQKRTTVKTKRVEKEIWEDDSDSSVEFDLNEDSDSDVSDLALHQRPPVTDEICFVCGEFGKNNELWFRCTVCATWAHSECTGWVSAEGYKCDLCKENDKKKEDIKRNVFK